MKSAQEWLLEKAAKKKPAIPTRDCFFTWPEIGTVGQDQLGNLFFQDSSDITIVAHKDMTPSIVRSILQQLVNTLGDGYSTCSAELF